ncbi:7TM receptor with intracellular metal dependent phosphohydrolase [Cyanobacterium stanieri PCC 7202]|uniref:7TM receptor with intracellular metal dependent phosphohydrolase n=1 Tax=Cyanobacterium stanieri (strain ATCC 29140 / PCC 7202) TaxID=292563 RepID=K9YJ57_CYASC|nr:7TM receptor with intracellular metal dependent phosphohydrolase [Cyanobacterium stanieri PCC 7202]
MKTLQSISQTLKRWQQNYDNPSHQEYPQQSCSDTEQNMGTKPKWFKLICKVHPPVMILLSVTTITGVISYRFYNQPELAVGTIAPTTIVAPEDGSFVDHQTTEEMRRNTRSGLLPTLRHDESATESIKSSIRERLERIQEAREILLANPEIETDVLSSGVQQYLRTTQESEWENIIDNRTDLNALSEESNSIFAQAIGELINYQQRVDEPEFENLINKIATQRSNYQVAETLLVNFSEMTDEDRRQFLDLDEQQWRETRDIVNRVTNRILTQGIPFGLPEAMRLSTVETHLSNREIPSPLKGALVRLIGSNLRTNLTVDEEATKARAERAAEEIEPIMVSVEQNETIVREGEQITQADFVLLDNFGLSRRSINWVGVLTSAALTGGGLVGFMAIATKRTQRRLRRRDQFLWWLLGISVPVISLFDVGYNSLPAVGFLMSSFYGPVVAVSHVSLTAGLTLFQTGAIGWEYLISSYASSILAAIIASRLRSREELAFLGGGVGLTQGAVYFVVTLASSAAVGTLWYVIIPGAIWHGAVGLTYGVIALGISPYLERFFDLITPIRLAELSNPNRPLLKRLATEAPGTFQHTMFVSSLAEAAARKLNCNVELVRAGTLYHDIGKMHDPLGFIENQMGGKNKHDQINDPWESADIIKKHVSEGLAMAKRHGLPQAIRNFIPEHQGTLLISYFYYQAQNQAEEDPAIEIEEHNFRYDGPIPQSRETGIVMLADGCEAALRSLKDATPEQAMAMVNKIFKARWRDHQLDDCGLRYDELPIIAEVFINVWQQFNHQRISYPKGALEMKTSK